MEKILPNLQADIQSYRKEKAIRGDLFREFVGSLGERVLRVFLEDIL